MIASIVLTNFQSHESTALCLAPGLNVITGPSDSGKTAIIRAIRWALYNEPRGDSFIRAGQRDCEVCVTFANGAAVIRSRRGKANAYVIFPEDGDEIRYEAFGADPPPEVAQVSGMPKVQIGERELAANFAYQLDGPFLLSESPLVAAKVLGKLAGTEEVDHAARLTATDVNRRRVDERRFAADAQRLEAELAKYAHLPEMAERIARLDSLTAEIRQAEARLARLGSLSAELAGLKQRQDELRARIGALIPVARLANALGCLLSGFQRLARLRTLTGLSSEQAAAAAKARAAILTATRTLGAEPVAARAGSFRDKLDTLTGLSQELAPVRQSLAANRASLARAAQALRAEAPALQASQTSTKLHTLHNYPCVLEDIAAARRAARRTYEAAAPVAAKESLAQGATQQAARLSALVRQQGALAALDADRLSAGSRAARLNQVLQAEELCEKAGSGRARLAVLESLRAKRADLRVHQSRTLNGVTLAGQAVATYQDSYVELLAEIGICPLCGSTVNPTQVKEVVLA